MSSPPPPPQSLRCASLDLKGADLCPWEQGRVWLIDLNPFGEVTDSLLFSWAELRSGELTQQQVSRAHQQPPA